METRQAATERNGDANFEAGRLHELPIAGTLYKAMKDKSKRTQEGGNDIRSSTELVNCQSIKLD